MKMYIFLGLLAITNLLKAADLPQTTLTFELDQKTEKMDLIVKILEQNPKASISIYADLNADNEKEEYIVKPKKKPRCEPNLDNDCDGLMITNSDSNTSSNFEQKSLDGIRDPQSGLPTGKRGHLYVHQEEVNISGSNMSILFETIDQKILYKKGWDGTVKGRNQIIESSKQLFHISFYDVDNGFNSFLRKGWDGTVKGSTKKQVITLVVKSFDGSMLRSFNFKIKETSEKIQSCSGTICGTTDHL